MTMVQRKDLNGQGLLNLEIERSVVNQVRSVINNKSKTRAWQSEPRPIGEQVVSRDWKRAWSRERNDSRQSVVRAHTLLGKPYGPHDRIGPQPRLLTGIELNLSYFVSLPRLGLSTIKTSVSNVTSLLFVIKRTNANINRQSRNIEHGAKLECCQKSARLWFWCGCCLNTVAWSFLLGVRRFIIQLTHILEKLACIKLIISESTWNVLMILFFRPNTSAWFKWI